VHVCYVDEAGCSGALPSPTSNVQPLLVIGGIFLARERLHELTHDFLTLKRQYFPGLIAPTNPYLHWVLAEVKGSDLRRTVRVGSRNERRHTFGFIDRMLDLLGKHEVRLAARIWVKPPGGLFDGRAVYTSSVQALATCFHHHIDHHDRLGHIVLDSRTKTQNAEVSFSVFTEKFRSAGDKYPRLVDMPTFGHSENHVGLQLADYICSALLYPMASHTYCVGYVQNVHVQPRYGDIHRRYAARLRPLQYRFQDETARWRGGITVSDPIGQRSGALLFQ
jgi:hypothetical protein